MYNKTRYVCSVLDIFDRAPIVLDCNLLIILKPEESNYGWGSLMLLTNLILR